MNILILGDTSKVANALKKNLKNQSFCNNLVVLSLRNYLHNKEFISKNVSSSDVIIYLVGDTRTNISHADLDAYVNSNYLLLKNFIKDNRHLLKTRKLIYFSSSKIYNLFPQNIKCDENLPFEQSLNFQEIFSIVNTLKTNADIVHLLCEVKPLDETYFPYYELLKASSELIIHKLLPSAYIVRPSYLFGAEEENNFISQQIYNAITGDKILLTTGNKDFVPYRLLFKLIEYIANSCECNAVTTINLCTGHTINEEAFKQYILWFNEICSTQSPIILSKKVSINQRLSNDKLLYILNNPGDLAGIFMEEISRIFSIMYIKYSCNFQIARELIGGSVARVYWVSDQYGSNFLVKLALGNGANNGSSKLRDEMHQIISMQKYLRKHNYDEITPRVYRSVEKNGFTFFVLECIEGKTFTDTYCAKDLSSLFFIKLLVKQICDIYVSGSHSIYQDMLNMNNGRVKDRLFEVYRESKMRENNAFSGIFTYENIIINGQIFKNPLSLLSEIRKQTNFSFNNAWGPCISGDAILDNCIYSEGKIYIVDPRGTDLMYIDGIPYFDVLYDLGKILFFLLGWKLIRKEQYRLKISNIEFIENTSIDFSFLDSPEAHLFRSLAKTSEGIFSEQQPRIDPQISRKDFLSKILLYAGFHFLSDTYPRIVGKGEQLTQCIAEYCLGTIIINHVYHAMFRKNTEVDFDIFADNHLLDD